MCDVLLGIPGCVTGGGGQNWPKIAWTNILPSIMYGPYRLVLVLGFYISNALWKWHHLNPEFCLSVDKDRKSYNLLVNPCNSKF